MQPHNFFSTDATPLAPQLAATPWGGSPPRPLCQKICYQTAQKTALCAPWEHPYLLRLTPVPGSPFAAGSLPTSVTTTAGPEDEDKDRLRTTGNRDARVVGGERHFLLHP